MHLLCPDQCHWHLDHSCVLCYQPKTHSFGHFLPLLLELLVLVRALKQSQVQNWIDFKTSIENKTLHHNVKQQPQLLLTISGEVGSGKSTLNKTIVGTLRRMFLSNSCVKVAAPTGSASFNGRGVTMHRLFGLPVHPQTHLLQNAKKAN